MEEVNLRDLLKFLVKKLHIIIIMAALGFAAAATYTNNYQEPLYKSKTTLLLVSKETKEGEKGITQNDILLNQKLVTTYREIIKSNKVLNKVKLELELKYSLTELAKSITVNTVKDTEIIEISVSNKNPKMACDTVNKIAEVFSKEIVDLYNIENIGVIDVGEESSTPYNVNLTKQIVIGVGSGIILSVAIIFIAFYFDNKIRSVEQVEEKIGLPIVGIIPVGRRRK